MATQGVPLWSKTAASNATADSAAPWPEGMAPSQVNDSSRGNMAGIAKWRDDLYGLTTAGTSTAFTVTTNATYATSAEMSGAIFTIIPHTTSGLNPTLSTDTLTARALNISTGVAIPTGALKSGTPYLVKFVLATTEYIVLGALSSLSLPGTLAVTGASTLTGDVTMSGNAAVVKTLTLKDAGDLASATALTLGDGNFYNITGTTATTSIGTKSVGTVVEFRANAAWPITHHATNLILLGGASITCAAGDMMEFEEYGVGTWRMTAFHRADGTPLTFGPAATQAQMEAASSNVVGVTPGRQQYHPSACKAWGAIAVPSTISAGYNVASISGGATGVYTVTFTTAMSSAAYAPIVVALNGSFAVARVTATTTTTFTVFFHDAAGSGVNPNGFYFHVFGDQP